MPQQRASSPRHRSSALFPLRLQPEIDQPAGGFGGRLFIRSRIRDQYLALGFDKKLIEEEYINAQERLQANLDEVTIWERQAGIADLARQRWDTLDEHWAAAEALAKIRPLSVADALALQDFVWTNLIELEIDNSMEDWEFGVLKNVHAYFQALG